MTFLVVDDSATTRRIVINSLCRIGFDDVAEATDGAEALERLDARIKFVIAGRAGPSRSGNGLARALRERANGAHLPILMMAGSRDRRERAAAVAAGASDCLARPFTPEALKEKIEQLLTRAAPGGR